jgi:hypothetical protein
MVGLSKHKTKTMKKLIILTASVLLMTSCEQPKRYHINDGDVAYTTDSYTMNGDCITFQSDCGCFNSKPETITMCGNYTVVENADYQP